LRQSAAGAHSAEVDHFVGRTAELAALDAEMQTVRDAEPRVVLVKGEPGIGKSSLLSRFLSRHRDLTVLRASGDDAEMLLAGESPTSFWPQPGRRCGQVLSPRRR